MTSSLGCLRAKNILMAGAWIRGAEIGIQRGEVPASRWDGVLQDAKQSQGWWWSPVLLSTYHIQAGTLYVLSNLSSNIQGKYSTQGNWVSVNMSQMRFEFWIWFCVCFSQKTVLWTTTLPGQSPCASVMRPVADIEKLDSGKEHLNCWTTGSRGSLKAS